MSSASEATVQDPGAVDEADEGEACVRCEDPGPDVMPRPISSARRLLCSRCADRARAIPPQLLASRPPETLDAGG